MKQFFSKELKINKDFLSDVPFTKEHMEKDFIIKFLSELPFEKLKELVNFKEIDYENKKLCNEAINNHYLQEKIKYLQSVKSIEFNANITI